MKRLFQILVVVALIVILFFEFRSYQRHRASGAYGYAVDSTIDWNYHNPELVKRYLFSAEEVGHYGRYAWSRHDVDVLTDSPTDPDSKELIQKYHSILAGTKYLEAKLQQSASWKLQGISNEEISALEQGHITIENHELADLLDNPIIARPSDQGALVFEIQKRLAAQGIELPIDGIYRIETETGVQTFQEQQSLYPSGMVDRLTLVRLFDQK